MRGRSPALAQVRAQDTTSVILGVAARGGASLQAAWTFVRTCGCSRMHLLLLKQGSNCSPALAWGCTQEHCCDDVE